MYEEFGNKSAFWSVMGIVCVSKKEGKVFLWLLHLRRKITSSIIERSSNFLVKRSQRIMRTVRFLELVYQYLSMDFSSFSLLLQYVLDNVFIAKAATYNYFLSYDFSVTYFHFCLLVWSYLLLERLPLINCFEPVPRWSLRFEVLF